MDVNKVGAEADRNRLGGRGGRAVKEGKNGPRMAEVRGHILRLFKFKRAQRIGISLNDLHEKVQAKVPFTLRKDYLTLAVVGKRGPYMFDADVRRVYYIGEGE